jgi:SAM-dependent methyltransferase
MCTITPADHESPDLSALPTIIEHLAAHATTALCILGQRVGLLDALAQGPATADDLAARAGADARYALEWARGLAAADYLTFDRATSEFDLRTSHRMLLTDEGGPLSFAGLYDFIGTTHTGFDSLVAAIRTGDGIGQHTFPDRTPAALAHLTAGIYDHQLTGAWLPLVEDVHERLQAGARVAEIGCGGGHALATLAGAYPASTFVGYDAFAPALTGAADLAANRGVEQRVRFVEHDATASLPEQADIVLAFDVLHDSADPDAILATMRDSLLDDGVSLVVEPPSADDPADNIGPFSTINYHASLSYCLPVSLAAGGPGLGTCGLPESALRSRALDAGFAQVDHVPTDHPTLALYCVRP